MTESKWTCPECGKPNCTDLLLKGKCEKPKMSEEEKCARILLLEKFKRNSIAWKAVNRKIDELRNNPDSTDEQFAELENRLELKEAKLKAEIDRMDFMNVIKSLYQY